MTTPTRRDTAHHQFLEHDAIQHGVVPAEIGCFSS